MPDDDWALGQNMVDVRNEARNPLNAMPLRFACRNPEQAWIEDQQAALQREAESPDKEKD